MKQVKTVVLILVIILWSGVYKFARYKIDMYYSNLAARQVEDDSAYAELQFHSTASNIALLVYLAVTAICVYLIYRIWSKRKPATSSDPS